MSAAAGSGGSEIPKTQTCACFESKGGPLVVKNAAVQEIGKYDVLVKVLACGVCHSEQIPQYLSQSYPRTPGHEVIGIVVKVGAEAKRWKGGEIVGRGWHGGHCFECVNCRKGDFIQCSTHWTCGWNDDGGYQEYMVAPWQSLAAVPAGMSPADAAPLLCAGITVFNSLRRQQNLLAGSLVGVQGVGGLGHYAIQFAVKMGYEVVAITSPDKIEWAKKLGAHHVIDTSKFPADTKATDNAATELKKLGGAKLIMCTGLGGEQMAALYGGLATDGALLTLGADQKPMPISSLQLITNRGQIRGWPSGTNQDSEDTMNFAQKFGIKSYVEQFPLEKGAEAYAHMLSGKPRFRVVLITKEGAKYKPSEKDSKVAESAAAAKH